MNTVKFVTSQYADRSYMEQVETKDGMRPTKRYTAKEYLRWPGRTKLANFTFVPGGERIIGNDYNLWPGWPREPKKGSVALWHKLLDNIFLGKPKEERKWFEQWVAYPIQHPGAKLKQAVLIWGGQGTGKSFLGEIIIRIYGSACATKFDNAKLNSAYNYWADSKQFALGEEIVVRGGKRGEILRCLRL